MVISLHRRGNVAFQVIFFLICIPFNLVAQSYRVEVVVTSPVCCTLDGLISFTGNIDYNGVSSAFNSPTNPTFPVNIYDRTFSSVPTGTLSISAYPFFGFRTEPDCRNSCSVNVSETFTPSTTSGFMCSRQSRTIRSGDGGVSYYVMISPVDDLEIENEAPSVQNYCVTEEIELEALPKGYGTYDWSYRTEGDASYIPIRSSSIEEQSFSATDIFGSSLEDNYGEEFYIQLELGNCDVTEAGAFRFYPDPPRVEGLTSNEILDVTCYGSIDGSISFNAGSFTDRALLSGESFIYMLYKGTEPDFEDNDSFVDSHRQSPAISNLNTTIEFSELESDNYWIFVYPQLIEVIDGEDVNVTSGCGEAFFYPLTINEPDEIQVTSSNLQSPSCYNGNASFDLNVSNGTPGFTYLLNGVTSINPNDPNSSTPSFDLNVDTYSALVNEFYIEVTDDNGCKGETDKIPGFINPALLSITSAPAEAILCKGDSTSLSIVLGEPIPENGAITYSIDGLSNTTGATSGYFTGIPAGDYTVRVTNTVGIETCVDTVNVSITEPTAVVGIFENMTEPTCSGGSDGSFDVAASGGTVANDGLYTFSLDGSDNTDGVFERLTPGTYTVAITDDNDCEGEIMVVVDDDPTPLEFEVSITDQTCSYTEDGIIEVININNELSTDITYSYYSTLDDFRYPNENDPIMDNLKADSYTVYVSDGTCEASLLNQIVGTPLPLSASELMDSVICYGESNGRLEVLVEGGTAPYEYHWEHDSELQENIVTSAAGTYILLIEDDQGCFLPEPEEPEPLSFDIKEPIELTADYEKTDITCHDVNDGTITLVNIQGGNNQEPYIYEWSDDPSINASERSSLPSGFYSVTISDRKGCTYTITDIEIINPTPVALSLVEQTNINCYGDNTGLLIVEMSGGVGNYEYSIDNGENWQPEPDFIGLAAGEYVVFARDNNLCETSIATVITEPSAPLSVSLTEKDATCETPGSITAFVSGGTPPYSYEWEGLEDTDNVIEVLAGNYPLKVTDANDCEVRVTGNLTSLDGAQVTIEDQQQPSCSYNADGTASINIVGISPFTVIWDHGELGTTVDELSIGENWYSVIDANGCLVREVVTFDAPQPLLLAVEEMERPSCNGVADGSFTVAISGGNGGYALTWDHGDTGTSLTNLTAGDYPVQITDGNTCILDTLVTLPEKELLELSIISTDPSCLESMDGTVEAVVTGGNGGYQYNWSNGVETTSQSGLDEGTYTVTVTDALGCETSGSVTLTDPPLTEVTIDDIAICSGQSYQVIARVEALSYSWTGPNDFTATGREAVVSEPGSYELTIIDLIGCEVREPFEVFIDDDALDADFLVAGTAYVGDTLLLIDITWPVPNDVSWELPEAARVISRTVDYAEIVFDEPGDYDLAMYCKLGGCDASYQQVISILSRTEETARAFEFAAPEEPMISEVGLYPNPTDDRTNLTITLKEKGDVVVSIIDLSGNEIKYYKTLTGLSAYGLRIDTNRLLPGLYFLQVEAKNEVRTLRLIVR